MEHDRPERGQCLLCKREVRGVRTNGNRNEPRVWLPIRGPEHADTCPNYSPKAGVPRLGDHEEQNLLASNPEYKRRVETTTTEPDERCFACAAGQTLHAGHSSRRAHLGTVYIMGVVQGAGYYSQRQRLPLCHAHRRELVAITQALETTLPPGAQRITTETPS